MRRNDCRYLNNLHLGFTSTTKVFNETRNPMIVWIISIDDLGRDIGQDRKTIPSKQGATFQLHENGKTFLLGCTDCQMTLHISPAQDYTLRELIWLE